MINGSGRSKTLRRDVMKGDFCFVGPIIFEAIVNLAGLANNSSPTVFPIANYQFPIASIEQVKK